MLIETSVQSNSWKYQIFRIDHLQISLDWDQQNVKNVE